MNRFFIDHKYAEQRFLLVKNAELAPLYRSRSRFSQICENVINVFKKKRRGTAVLTSIFPLAFFPFNKFERTFVEICGKSNFFDFDQMARTLPWHKRVIARIIEILFREYFHRQIRKANALWVATPDLLSYAKKIRSDAFWLPMQVTVPKTPKRKNAVFTVFIPTRFHPIKNMKRVLPLLDVVDSYKKEYQVILIDWSHVPQPDKPLMKLIQRRYKGVEILPFIEKREEFERILMSSDIVFGQFGKETSAFGRIELETIAAKVPLIALDLYETKMLKAYHGDLEGLLKKILSNGRFRVRFVRSNYNDVMRNHSSEAIKKLLRRVLK